MSIQIFPADNRTTINWASGTSTEIFIYPSNANFAERNFLFRISTATVEAEESNFTYFKEITRHLMVLKGELELIHEGRYTKHLKPFDQDVFSGEWTTHSKGKVTDFNLMLKGGSTGSLKHHRIDPTTIGSGASKAFSAKASYYFIYFVAGAATLGKGSFVKPGDLISIDKDTDLTVHVEKRCDLIEIEVSVQQEDAV